MLVIMVLTVELNKVFSLIFDILWGLLKQLLNDKYYLSGLYT